MELVRLGDEQRKLCIPIRKSIDRAEIMLCEKETKNGVPAAAFPQLLKPEHELPMHRGHVTREAVGIDW
jgi:hypothetical protein